MKIGSDDRNVWKKKMLPVIKIWSTGHICSVSENSSAQSFLQRSRGCHEKAAGGWSLHGQKGQGESREELEDEWNQFLTCVNVCFSWKPQRSTGPAEEEAFQPCSSSWTREPSSPTGTRLGDDVWVGWHTGNTGNSPACLSEHMSAWPMCRRTLNTECRFIAAQHSPSRRRENRTLQLCWTSDPLWSRRQRQRQSKSSPLTRSLHLYPTTITVNDNVETSTTQRLLLTFKLLKS